MVFGPGNYQFHDFLMVGGVLVAVLTPAAGVFTYYLVKQIQAYTSSQDA